MGDARGPSELLPVSARACPRTRERICHSQVLASRPASLAIAAEAARSSGSGAAAVGGDAERGFQSVSSASPRVQLAATSSQQLGHVML